MFGINKSIALQTVSSTESQMNHFEYYFCSLLFASIVFLFFENVSRYIFLLFFVVKHQKSHFAHQNYFLEKTQFYLTLNIRWEKKFK